jgi:long-chain acyl-CoA synthetase
MPPDGPSVPQCFLDAIDRRGEQCAQMYRSTTGWQSISAKEMLRRVAGLARALGELGIHAGDRLGLFAPNSPEWHVADLAIQGWGAVTVPVYFRESSERLTYILNDSGARIVFTAGEEQARRVQEIRQAVPGLQHVICAGPPADLHGDVLRYESLIANAGEGEIGSYRQQARTVMPDQLATIIYTSGTTGEPKGVMLNQANLTSNAFGFSGEFDMSPSDLALSLLPLAHVYERTIDYGYMFRGVPIAYVEQMETVAQALVEVKPTTVAAVPRFYEKIYAGIIEKGHHETAIKRRIFDAAIRIANQAVPWRAHNKPASPGLRWRWRIADRIVYSKIRQGLGGRIRTFSSGGAPLAPELAEFFWSVGLPVYEGYGLTETSPVVTFNSPKANKVGTVGRPIAGVQVRIAEDGEILVKGSCVMQGYYRKANQTREVFTPDGWFCTGDIGQLDEEQYLTITDRKKELLKTAGGKFVAPAPIENQLKTSPFISNAMIVGDKRKFVSALIVPDFTAIEVAGRKAGREFSTPSQMVSDSWVRDLLSGEIERLTRSLAQYEKPKRFALLEQDFSYHNGELTYTLKMKRRVIEQRYADLIERLYADVEEPRPQRIG